MASRTKSFFEQDNNKTKPRPGQWRGQNRPPLAETHANTPCTKPPIPATSQAKTKLKAFQFVAGEPCGSGQDDDAESGAAGASTVIRAKESQGQATATGALERQYSSSVTSAKSKQKSDTPQLPHAHTFPCTPGTRLPLEDLIGNYDDSSKLVTVRQPSPEEHIGWIPNSSSNLLTPSRKRKRARSSSPSCPNTSSQRQEASAFFAGTAVPGAKTTPEADPAADLWKRYGTDQPTEDGVKVPEFDQLMFQASPRRLETPVKSAGLRRWASTGNHWPTSKNKRRRTQTNLSIGTVQEQPVVDSAGRSKVAAMVEKLQESLASQKLETSPLKAAVMVDAPSSSSPLPEVGGVLAVDGVPLASPLQEKQQSSQARPTGLDIQVPAKPTTVPAQGCYPAKHRHSSPEPDHTDNKQTLAVADAVLSAPLQLKSKAPLPAYRRPTIARTVSGGRQYPQRTPPLAKPLPAIASATFDEFGDDLDLSAEDLEELMTQPPPLHQRPLQQIPAHPDPPPQTHMAASGNSNGAQPTGQAKHPIVVDEFDDDDDEFGSDGIDEAAFAQAEISATQAYRASQSNSKISDFKQAVPEASYMSKDRGSNSESATSSKAGVPPNRRQFERYVVKQVVDGEYTNAKGRRCPEKVVVAEGEHASWTVAITLRDSWATTPLARETIVHVTSLRKPLDAMPVSSRPSQILISDAPDSPLLIIHPDHMLSAGTVADSYDCTRKAVFKDRVRGPSEQRKPMIYGTILHEIFQQALSTNRWDEEFLADVVETTVENHVDGLWELGMQDTTLAIEEIKAKMGEMASWARIYVAEQPSDVAIVDGPQVEKLRMSISKVIAIEEHIWSPGYGLNGNIDATVQATIVDRPNNRKLVYPVEVKTGKTTHAAGHMVQTALYTLLMSDRYDTSVTSGILYYLESSTMTRISPPVIEMRSMIQQRNRLAAFHHRAKHPVMDQEEPPPLTQEIEESGLPGLARNTFKCGRCFAQASCFTYHALAEDGSAESAGMMDDGKQNHGAVWAETVGHLLLGTMGPNQVAALKQWFVKWDRLLTFEESHIGRIRKELWTMDSTKREAVGRCFGNLIISRDLTSTTASAASSVTEGISGAGGKIARFGYVFARSGGNLGTSFTEGSQLTAGEPVVVSSECGQWALATGYLLTVGKHNVTVAVDRKLGNARQRLPDFDHGKSQNLKGIMTVGKDADTTQPTSALPMLYRIDKDEFANGLAKVRSNLVGLMSSHPINAKLRNQLILGKKPTFDTVASSPVLPASQLGQMNEDQRATVAKVLSAQDYTLILGMPGTGKTTTIAHIIRALLAEKKSILLSSYTHTAVDNILLNIRDIAPADSILRIGVPAKINAQVREFCLLADTPRKSIAEIENAYLGCQIVATTCMGTSHAIFQRRAFDVCIVDEASQITLPISLGPLLHARRFVLVGDHYQLPPLVQNKAALEGGLDVSLFRQLSEEQPEAVATLGKQYRMCEEIMTLANVLIYNGKLRCGSDAVAYRKLQDIDLSALTAFHGSSSSCGTPSLLGRCWLNELCKPERKVVFANIDPAGKAAFETLNAGKNITNELEATLVAQLVLSLLAIGVPAKDIGVISLYRSQLALMRRLFKLAGVPREVDIDTADRFQGRDKECIILSMVRSNASGIVGDLLKDWRRVNVALTRAKSKLIVLGSRQTLRNNELLAKFLKLVDEKRWSMDLPSNADTCHSFDFSSQAASALPIDSTPSPEKNKATTKMSPVKSRLQHSPTKLNGSPGARVLQESASAGNRSLKPSQGRMKVPGKVISGRKQMEQAAFQIFEDLTGDDL